MTVTFVVELLLAHSQALALVVFGAYIAYEIRAGAIEEVRRNQRTLGVALYRVIERDGELNEEAFRDALWDDEGREKVLLSDLERGD